MHLGKKFIAAIFSVIVYWCWRLKNEWLHYIFSQSMEFLWFDAHSFYKKPRIWASTLSFYFILSETQCIHCIQPKLNIIQKIMSNWKFLKIIRFWALRVFYKFLKCSITIIMFLIIFSSIRVPSDFGSLGDEFLVSSFL